MADNDDIMQAEAAMTQALHNMKNELHQAAIARQIVELAGERRKSSLSRLVVEHLNQDRSASESEHRARADNRYRAELNLIGKQTANAEEIIMRYELARHQYEAARSILSVRRAQIGLV